MSSWHVGLALSCDPTSLQHVGIWHFATIIYQRSQTLTRGLWTVRAQLIYDKRKSTKLIHKQLYSICPIISMVLYSCKFEVLTWSLYRTWWPTFRSKCPVWLICSWYQWPQFDPSRSLKFKMDNTNWKPTATFLFMFNSNYGSRKYHYQDTSHFIASDLNLTLQGHSSSKWTTLIKSQ